MKILFSFFNPSGGMETLNRIRSRSLMEQGHECHLLYTYDGEGRKNIKGIRTHILTDEPSIIRLVEREHYDVIVVCTDIVLLERIKRMDTSALLIFEIQGLGTMQTAIELLKQFDTRIRSCADALLYPETAHLRQLLQARFPELPQFCFDNPLDTENFRYVSYPPKPYPILGWVGRLEANKNWRDFLLLGAQLLRYRKDLYLWMFEDATLYEPSERADFEVMVRTLNLSDRLIRYSNVPHEQMADYLSMIGDSGGLLCSTSILEGFGYAVAEALLCRCPVLATDSDGIRRFLHHNKTGKFYTRGQLQSAYVEAVALMTDMKLRESVREQGEQIIRRSFSTKLYNDQFSRMLRQLLPHL
ncbi:glycosyltransferase family 4 protein [Paenibacillus sp. GCM10023252]|uniref:glycosyltransferase family 4 protein n=1 Tax=Paenibacillus sp. GCM10023252 TaxID=3252649 RepID=UPI003607B82C